MSSADFTQLNQFVTYANKRLDLSLLAGTFADGRPRPEIASRPVWLSLVLGEVAHIPSFLQLESETGLPQWQRWVGYRHKVSHDTFGYVSEHFDPEPLRRGASWIHRKLKRGKAFEASKVNGLLTVSLDTNEQFCRDHRCCADCLSREITSKNADGQEVNKTQYYHKQVYAQLSGPQWSVILDFKPMRQGEEEGAVALRLLRRLRKGYGPRFFDAVVVDSWYANGPFLKTVVAELGWPVVAVLKQERYEVHQEVLALTRGRKPAQQVQRDGRRVAIWDLDALRFSDTYPDPVRVVRARETWTERQRVAGEWQKQEKEQNWIWVVAGDLGGYDGGTIRDIGHLRWKIENHALGELTQHEHLTHCSHHHPTAVVAWLWIKLIAFTLLHAFAILHGKTFRLGLTKLNELRKQLYRSLLCGQPIPWFSGCSAHRYTQLQLQPPLTAEAPRLTQREPEGHALSQRQETGCQHAALTPARKNQTPAQTTTLTHLAAVLVLSWWEEQE
ncbi:MAG: transposase [Verrucomicrobiae bacterium]|nr:transposase [Verrucomicrobiae bacterium]